MVKNMFKWSL